MPKEREYTAYDFTFEAQGGEAQGGGSLPLSSFAGRPLLIVNTASKCGFTPQYAALQELWRRHKGSGPGDKGLVVLGVPSDDFGGQEPGSDSEIAQFCATRFSIDFPMTAKTRIRGKDAHPFFRWVAAEGGFLARPRWNFYKYLIDRDGHLAGWFSSLTRPDSARMEAAVTKI